MHTGKGKLTSPWFKITKKNILLNFAGWCIYDVKFQLVGQNGQTLGVFQRYHEAEYKWSNWNVEPWMGKTVRLEAVDNNDEYVLCRLSIREIYMSDSPESMLENNLVKLWKAVELSAESVEERMNVVLTKQALEVAGLERVLASNDKNLRALVEKIAVDRGCSLEDIALEEQNELLYAENLKRLRAVKFHPHPMPGVEAAALDSKGRIVPAMEKELEKYPTSPAGDRHRARLAKLEKIITPLLKTIDQTGRPEKRKVFLAAAKLDAMWNETIRELPKLIYLDRPTYLYDSMMYIGNGTRDAVIKSFDPAAKRIETILDARSVNELRINEFNLSWDGNTIYMGGGGQVSSVNCDGTGFRTITSGQSPMEMPDGRVVFFDNDAGQSPCKATAPRMPLFICASDGKNRKIVSGNTCIDNAPSVMNDGRIIFTRWDYGVNKNVFNRHALWTQNPDGTGMELYFGNTVIDPRSFGRPRQIPGRPEILTVFAPHHSKLTGLMGLVWNGEGSEAKDGLGFRRITHDTASVGDNPQIWSYQDPYPINEQLFLVTFGGRPNNKAGLYLYDRSGNRKCILESNSTHGIHSAQPFTAKKRPLEIPDRSISRIWKPNVDLHERLLSDPDWTDTGTLILQDVYLGLEPEIKRGQIKYLAVMEQPLQSHPRGGAIGVGTIWFVNRFLGLVPVEEDGSAHFEVPALRSLYFHALDKDGKMLMTQGSDFHVMPGERRGCLGCHEQRKGITSPPNFGKVPMASKKPPVRPKLPDWGTRGVIEYETVVQPVFDKYCIQCHSGEKPKGRLNLSGDRTTAYNMSYMQLTDGMYVHFTPGTGSTHSQPTNDYDEQAPLSRGSVLSKLTKYIQDEKHSKNKIPFEDQLKVFLWIDSNVPFFSHYRQEPPAILSDTARSTLVTVHANRCASCHNPDKIMPDEKSGLRIDHIWRHHPSEPVGQWGVAESGMRVRHVNLSNPSHSAVLQAPLAVEAGGWGLCGSKQNPVFKDKNDGDYKLMLDSIQNGVVERTGIMTKGIKELLEEKTKNTLENMELK
jgi:mono/diheme cytochrome c family protein